MQQVAVRWEVPADVISLWRWLEYSCYSRWGMVLAARVSECIDGERSGAINNNACISRRCCFNVAIRKSKFYVVRVFAKPARFFIAARIFRGEAGVAVALKVRDVYLVVAFIEKN